MNETYILRSWSPRETIQTWAWPSSSRSNCKKPAALVELGTSVVRKAIIFRFLGKSLCTWAVRDKWPLQHVNLCRERIRNLLRQLRRRVEDLLRRVCAEGEESSEDTPRDVRCARTPHLHIPETVRKKTLVRLFL